MPPDLTDDDAQALIDYARRKFAAEPYPLAPALKLVRRHWLSSPRPRSARRCRRVSHPCRAYC
jgi:hypothetical protein